MLRGVRDPLNGLRIMPQMLVDGHVGSEPQLRIRSRAAAMKSRSRVIWICFPLDSTVGVDQGIPCETVVRAHLGIVKAVLAVAPGSEDQFRFGVCIDYEMSPARR